MAGYSAVFRRGASVPGVSCAPQRSVSSPAANGATKGALAPGAGATRHGGKGHEALYVFTHRVLPGVVPVSFAVRVLLGGAAASD